MARAALFNKSFVSIAKKSYNESGHEKASGRTSKEERCVLSGGKQLLCYQLAGAAQARYRLSRGSSLISENSIPINSYKDSYA